MEFPTSLLSPVNSRANRMLSAGRVTITVSARYPKTWTHVTVLFKCFVDNRDRKFKEIGKNWEACQLHEATHVFIEVPNQTGWNDKIGTFYPRTGKFFVGNGADPERVECAIAAAHWLTGDEEYTGNRFGFQEESHCGVCGLPLTDPESIERGIGPTCFGRLTTSQHQVKDVEEDMPGGKKTQAQLYAQMQQAGMEEDFEKVEELAAAQTALEIERLGSLERVAGRADKILPDFSGMNLADLENLLDEVLKEIASHTRPAPTNMMGR